jgi:hypothetical protein
MASAHQNDPKSQKKIEAKKYIYAKLRLKRGANTPFH